MPKARTRRRSFMDYWPIVNPGNKGTEVMDRMYETFGSDWDKVVEVQKKSPSKVWTLVDGEGRDMYICAGYHRVNRIGYFITEEPWENDDIQYKL